MAERRASTETRASHRLNPDHRAFADTLEDRMPRDLRERLARWRRFAMREDPPRLSDESRWYTEHTALLISTLKWALLGATAGLCVGIGTRAFLWTLRASGEWVSRIRMGPL